MTRINHVVAATILQLASGLLLVTPGTAQAAIVEKIDEQMTPILRNTGIGGFGDSQREHSEDRSDTEKKSGQKRIQGEAQSRQADDHVRIDPVRKNRAVVAGLVAIISATATLYGLLGVWLRQRLERKLACLMLVFAGSILSLQSIYIALS